MLAGQRLKERRVSQLSLSDLAVGDTLNSKQKGEDSAAKPVHKQTRSKFRTSIDVDDENERK